MSGEVSVLAPRDVIEDIRSTDFMIDLEGESLKVRRGAKSLQQKLNRALKQLSVDLYSKQTHFVLELIQNADDNEYRAATVPHLVLRLTPNELVLVNNELGFEERHVRAICDVAQSSKVKTAGYIGEKGIGFKSVFLVSESPEVHSRGYHFRFDISNASSPLGYIVPHWCPPHPAAINGRTTIVLPAKPDFQFGEEHVKDLNSKLLLFLNKLREITVEVSGIETVYSRKDDGQFTLLNSTKRTSAEPETQKEERFVRVEKSFSMEDVSDEKRVGIAITTMVLAFPVGAEGRAVPDPTSLVYAFLPIRECGFNFSVQADFLLSSSREDILADRPWNKRLRDCIISVFKDAIQEFRKSKELARTFLRYLPTDATNLDPFFRPVVDQLFKELKGTACLPTANGDWRKPSDLKYGHKGFRELFPQEVSEKLFGFGYVDEKLDAPQDLLKRLGASPITYVDLVEVFRSHVHWLKGQPVAWLARLYAVLADTDRQLLLQTGLEMLPCIPTASGDFVSPKQAMTFFPLGKARKYGFEAELLLLHDEILEEASLVSKNVHGLFASLGVRTDDPYQLVTSHILRLHSGEAWRSCESRALVGHVRYVKDKFEDYLEGARALGKNESDAVRLLREGLQIGTKQDEGDWLFSRVGTLYLGKEYKPPFCIETLLEGELSSPSLFVSKDYIVGRSRDTDGELESWREFFGRLGVRTTPALIAAWNGNHEFSNELRLLLTSSRPAVRKATLECMDQHWFYYETHLEYTSKIGRSLSRRETTFASSLKQIDAPTRKRTTSAISKCYYPSQQIREVFGEKATYLDARISNVGFLDACGVTHRLDARAYVKRLQQLKSDGGDTLQNLRALYRGLESCWEKEKEYIQQSFRNEPLIRVKGSTPTWLYPDDVTWRSSGEFLDALYPPLQHQYKDFSSFFPEKIGIPRELPPSKWVAALSDVAELDDANERNRHALTIYRRLNRDLGFHSRRGSGVAPEWLEDFEYGESFLDHHGNFVEKSAGLYINDHEDYARLFSDVMEVSFLDVPAAEIPRLANLLDAVGIEKLSDCVEVEVARVDGGIHLRELTARLRQAVPFVAQVLYSRSLEVFEHAVETGVFSFLKEASVVEVPQLLLSVTLAEVTREMQASVATHSQEILVRSGISSVEFNLAAEVSRSLGLREELTDSIALMLGARDSTTIKDLLRIRKVPELPEDVRASMDGFDSTAQEEDASSREECGEFEEPPLDEQYLTSESVQLSANDIDAPEVCDAADDVHWAPRAVVGSGKAQQVRSGAGARPASDEQAPEDSPAKKETVSSGVTSVPPPSLNLSSSSPRQVAQEVNSNQGEEPSSAPRVSSGTFSTPRTSTSSSHAGIVTGTSVGTSVGVSSTFEQLYGGAHRVAPSGGGGRRSRGSSSPSRSKGGRLLSYADSPEDVQRARANDEPFGDDSRVATGNAAVAFFVATQSHRWRSLTTMDHNNPGFDVLAVAHDGATEYIEVKGQSGAWTQEGVALTPTELSHAQREGRRYWLCVVEFVHEESRRELHLLNDPFGLTGQFRYDSGWKSVTQRFVSRELKPEVDVHIELPGHGRGVILSAKKKGAFWKLHVSLDKGGQVFRVFNPSTMRLLPE